MIEWLNHKLDNKTKRIFFVLWCIIFIFSATLTAVFLKIAHDIKNSSGLVANAYDSCTKIKIAKFNNLKLKYREDVIREQGIEDGLLQSRVPEVDFEDRVFNKLFEKEKYINEYYHIIFSQTDNFIGSCIEDRLGATFHRQLSIIGPLIVRLYAFSLITLILILFGQNIWNSTGGRLLRWINAGNQQKL
ncbi:hypothetical protein [Rhabdaerophilum sp. SD176]|uniref:hypothetical protein n=1 Tax=Rhabdaerophilum sp. SD176 TaxID=2983548 RepID=UPI0024DFD65C|nr:hypothetical protein [Rhabdaerophilum sp. SD176]